MSAQAIVSTGAKVVSAQSKISQTTKNDSVESNFGDLLSNNLKTSDTSKPIPDLKKDNGIDSTPEAKVNRQMTKNPVTSGREEEMAAKTTDSTTKVAESANTETKGTISEDAKVTEVTNMIKSIVKETLKIDDEKLAELMSSLGFTMVDLLNQDNLKQLCMASAGTTDVMGLVTNENLANQFANLSQALGKINLGEFGISKEQLNTLLAQVDQSAEMAIKNETTDIQTATVRPDQISAPTTEQEKTLVGNQTIGQDKQTPVAESKNGTDNIKVYIEKMTTTDETAKNNLSGQNQKDQSEESPTDLSGNKSSESVVPGATSQRSNRENATETAADQIIKNLAVSTTQNANGVELQRVEVTQIRDIVTQIVREIRVNIKPDLTSMELQLNPENLGRVNLSVVSKDGAMTAQFTVTNMIAKEAIESQMQLLKDNLNQQGVKVESIEVTVSNFGFSQGDETAKGNQEQNSNTRRFRGDIMEEQDTFDETTMDDVMRMNGSTVDYSA